MTKQVKYFIFAAIFIVFMAAVALIYPTLKDEYSHETPSQPSEQTQALPDFKIENKDGEFISIKDFKGKPTVINFWASWCGPCKKEMPMFEEMYKTYGEDVNFVMLNSTDGSRETKAIADEFIAKNEYTFPIFYDSNNQEATIACGVRGIPSTLFINADGEVVSGFVSTMSEESFLKEFDKIYTRIQSDFVKN